MIRRSEASRAAYAAGSSSRSNRSVPATPNRSLIGTATPHLARTAWTPALHRERIETSLARYAERRIMPRSGSGG